MQICSLAEGVCCKATALAASALATNTYVSAINLYQCSAAGLNPYSKMSVSCVPSPVRSFTLSSFTLITRSQLIKNSLSCGRVIKKASSLTSSLHCNEVVDLLEELQKNNTDSSHLLNSRPSSYWLIANTSSLSQSCKQAQVGG